MHDCKERNNGNMHTVVSVLASHVNYWGLKKGALFVRVRRGLI